MRPTAEVGWPVAIEEGHAVLRADQGIVGLAVPLGMAESVAADLVTVPVIALPEDPPRWIFLAETPAGRCPDLPVGVGLFSGLSRIPLPPTRNTSWVREPVNGRVPSFMTLLRVVRAHDR